jgi:hypothetical protein
MLLPAKRTASILSFVVGAAACARSTDRSLDAPPAATTGSTPATSSRAEASEAGSPQSAVITAGPAGASDFPAGSYLVAIDTPLRTYVDFVRVPASGHWAPHVDGWPRLAEWEHQTIPRATRWLRFAPGDRIAAEDVEAFLPATALASRVIDVTAEPYRAAPSPADATPSIAAALRAAAALATEAAPVDVLIPAGTYDYAAVLEVGANVRLRGSGGVLRSTRPATSAVHLAGDRSGALFLRIIAAGEVRASTPDSSGIWVGPRGPSGAPVHDTLVVGNEVVQPAGAHIFAIEEIGGLWAFNDAHDGFADAFHHTGRSQMCQVVANRAHGSSTRGDDLYAFIGYARDRDPVHHCTCIANWGRDGHARGLAAVGAGFVAFQDNDIARTESAGVYLAREQSFDSFGSFDITVERNRIANANLSSTHDGLLAYADEPDASAPSMTFGAIPNRVRDLTIEGNTFDSTASGRGNGFGIEVRGSCEGGRVAGNDVERSRSPGILVGGAGFTVSGNTVSP